MLGHRLRRWPNIDQASSQFLVRVVDDCWNVAIYCNIPADSVLCRYICVCKIYNCTSDITVAVMAEWLRRWTRNPMGSSRVGSNPTRSEILNQDISMCRV